MKRTVAVIFMFLCLLVQAAAPGGLGLGQSEDQKIKFKNTLESLGFDVDTRGQLICMDLTEKFCEGIWPCGFGFNADSPYLVFKMDPQSTGFQAMTFQMRPDEAIVFMGQTPPEALYFSFTALLNVRFFPQERTAKLLMANLGDSINLLNIKTMGTPGGLPGNPFRQLTIVILAADRTIEAMVHNVCALAGFPRQIINTLPIPAPMVHFGKTFLDDRLAVAMRCAFFKNNEEGDIYLGRDTAAHGESVSPFGVVWRVTPKTAPPAVPADPFIDLPLRVRGSGTTEFNLWRNVDTLRSAILSKYAGYEALELDAAQWVPEGAEGIQRGICVLAPTRDSWYLRTQGQFTLADDEFLIVYGVNHKASGKALYSNVVLYAMDHVETDFPILPNVLGEPDWREYIGLVTINSEEHMQGSAGAFLPASDIPLNAKGEEMLYAVKIARRLDPSDGVVCRMIPSYVCQRVTLNEFMLGFRAYIEQATQVGASYSEMILDRVIKFRPRR